MILKSTLFNFIFLCFVSYGMAQTGFQTTVNGSNGVQVVITVVPTKVLVHDNGNGCQYGYTYNIEYQYDIKAYDAQGHEISYTFYTMQGNFETGDGSTIFFDLPNNTGSGTGTSSTASSSRTDCATVVVGDLLAPAIKLDVNGPDIANQSVDIPANYNPAPITLSSFSAVAKDNKTYVAWSTSSESNNDFFTVQRSENTQSWQDVATVKGVGNSSVQRDYTWVDNNPPAGVAYYRLKQTDFDGRTELSEIRPVNHPQSQTFSAYPNPVKDQLTVTGVNTGKPVRLFNLNGQELTNRITGGAGFSKISIDMSDLPKGVYIIANGNQQIRVVK